MLTRSCKRKLEPSNSSTGCLTDYNWVSGTNIRNYMIKDPLVDWLKLYSNSGETSKEPEFLEFIKQAGIDFEKNIVEFIHKNIHPVVSLLKKEPKDQITDDTCNNTIRLMNLGTPIIHSAPFQNKKNHTKGVIDLLVRSDYINILVNDHVKDTEIKSPKLKIKAYTNYTIGKTQAPYHYIVVDIKFSTIPLRADGVHILNSGNYPAYKAQLLIYTQAIGEIQGYTSRYAYILGRRWNYTSKGEYFSGIDSFDKFGTIDFQEVDSIYEEKTLEASNWVREVRKKGSSWSVNPPSRIELYPNLCVDSGIWNTKKQEIANNIGDITQIWNCGPKHRENAFSKGIYSWMDPKCTSIVLGINGKNSIIVDKILEINRQNKDLILPSYIHSSFAPTVNLSDWREDVNEVFVDFETFCDVGMVDSENEEFYSNPKSDRIFMIGVYHKKGDYINYTIKENTDQEEFRIMDQFVSLMKALNYPKMWYWHADKSIWNRYENKYMDLACEEGKAEQADYIVDNWRLDNWADLYQIFKQEPIVIKDCFSFGLKDVAQAMYKHKMISTFLDSDQRCLSGLDASVKAWKEYQKGVIQPNNPVLEDISNYNKFDVKVLEDILKYLRRNM